MTDDIQEILKRVRAGSVDAEADIIEVVSKLRTAIIYHSWELIETAPVEPYDERRSYRVFPCMLQYPSGPVDHVTWAVAEGEGYWVPPRHGRPAVLRWRTRLGQCFPKYWMPLPAPRQD